MKHFALIHNLNCIQVYSQNDKVYFDLDRCEHLCSLLVFYLYIFVYMKYCWHVMSHTLLQRTLAYLKAKLQQQ